MNSRYILLFLGVVSLVWIIYAGIDLVDKKSEFSPAHLFGEKDGKVLIINEVSEGSLEQYDFKPLKELSDFFLRIVDLKSSSNQYYISELQNQMIIKNREEWSKEKVISFFNRTNSQVIFDSRHSFKVNGFLGKYNFSTLHLYKKEVVKPVYIDENWLDFDLKSSASIVSFSNKKFNITDIYTQKDSQIEYVTKISGNRIGKQIDDEMLFSQALPNDLVNYHFYEKEYFSKRDQIFRKGPLFQWMEKGFVEFEYDGHFVLVSDFIAGQDPVLIMNEMVSKSKASSSEIEYHFQNISLTKTFPENISRGFYLKMMDDYMVVSTSLNVCEQVIADYKLGNTLAMKKDKLTSFHQLPKKVSERMVGENAVFTKSIYNGKLFETRLKSVLKSTSDSTSISEIEKKETSKAISMFVGTSIQSFRVFNGSGNIVAITKKGELSCFKSGKSSWKKDLNDEVVGEIQLIDFKSDGEEQILCTTRHGIHLFDKSGNYVAGFPIKQDAVIINDVRFYQWNRTSNFAFVTDKKELVILDVNGNKKAGFKTGLQEVSSKVDVWVSNRILLAAVRDQKECILFNIDKKKEHRRFTSLENAVSRKKENEMIFYGMERGQLLAIDQKGNRRHLLNATDGEIIKEFHSKNAGMFAIQSRNELIFVQNEKVFGRLTLPFSELDDVDIASGPDGVTYISVIDGLSNNVSLFTLNGKLINKDPLEGKEKCILNWTRNKSRSISTIVDGYIVQYDVE